MFKEAWAVKEKRLRAARVELDHQRKCHVDMTERVNKASRDVDLYRDLTGTFFNKYQLATAEVHAMKAELGYVKWEAGRAKERRDEAEEEKARLKGQVEEEKARLKRQVEDTMAEKRHEVALLRAQSAIYQQKALSMENWLVDYVQNKEIQCMQLQAEMLVQNMKRGLMRTAEASYVRTLPQADSETREPAGQPRKSGEGTVEDASHRGEEKLRHLVLAATSRKKKKMLRTKMARLNGHSLQKVVDVCCMKPVGKVER